ncbi:MAG TPA: hypothetical protein DDW55_14215 [Gammaproteobacteria bacterium]|nr:hypothetical protein [Gammaproteobacteria bacterium]
MKLRIVGLLVVTASAFMITACGQKGPLYLPGKEAPAEQAAPAAVPAEGAEAANDEKADTNTEKDETSRTDK